MRRPDAVPARPRPHRPLEAVPAAEGEDAGLHRPEGDHYRTRMTHTLETTAISRVVARALRLNEDLTEAIGLGHDTGPHAVRARRRGCARRRAPGAIRAALPPQRAVAPDRALAQPHARGLRRDPHPHGRARARDTRGEDRAARRPGRVHQPRHRRRRAVRAARARTTFRARRSRSSGDRARSGSTGSSTTSSSRRRASTTSASRPRWGRRCSRCARSCSSGSTSARRRRRSTRRRTRSIRAIFDHLVERGDDVDEIVDYIAGMTDRFALDLRGLALSPGERALDLGDVGRRVDRAVERERTLELDLASAFGRGSIRRPACLRRFASIVGYPRRRHESAAAVELAREDVLDHAPPKRQARRRLRRRRRRGARRRCRARRRTARGASARRAARSRERSAAPAAASLRASSSRPSSAYSAAVHARASRDCGTGRAVVCDVLERRGAGREVRGH